jgi:NAD(P)H dehydrogenase (quinone)
MKHLIIYAHPNPESLNSYFKNTVANQLRQNGHAVRIRDLYQLNFNPVLSMNDAAGQRGGIMPADVLAEQEHVIWADILTFIYPIWWTGLPAMMKGYIDRVFSYGFAYRYDQGVQRGLLTGKKAVIINTHGKSNAEYESIGMNKALSLTSDHGVYRYCGLDVKQHFFFDRADRPAADSVERWTHEIKACYQ